MINKICLVVLLSLGVSGCLTTRGQLRGDEVKKSTITPAQEKKAQEVARLDEIEEEFRSLRGRIEVLENQIALLNNGNSEKQAQDRRQISDIEKTIRLFEEALKKMEAQIESLGEEIKTLKVRREAPAPTASNTKDAFKVAEVAYAKKEWKQAIVEYENYRKSSPRGKNYPVATYKIGLAFHELGMKDEARTFYEEVASKFPSSKEAKKASQKLKAMK